MFPYVPCLTPKQSFFPVNWFSPKLHGIQIYSWMTYLNFSSFFVITHSLFFLLDFRIFFPRIYFSLSSNLWFNLNLKLIRIFLFVFINIMNSGIKPPPFDWWFPYSLAVWHWTSYLSELIWVCISIYHKAILIVVIFILTA